MITLLRIMILTFAASVTILLFLARHVMKRDRKIARIGEASRDVVVVTLGAPSQDSWLVCIPPPAYDDNNQPLSN